VQAAQDRCSTRTVYPKNQDNTMTPPTRPRILSELAPIRTLWLAAKLALAPLGFMLLVALTFPVAAWQGTPLGSAWHALIAIAFVGLLLAYVLHWRLSFHRCPACRQRLFWGPPRLGATRFNPFARRCLHCGLRLDGSNLDEILAPVHRLAPRPPTPSDADGSEVR
jgi:hypothetical protein